jgi:hypothetical protein
MEIVLTATGKSITEQEFRAMYPRTSLPQQLSQELLKSYDADVVFEGPQAQPTRYQVAYRNGVEQINGKWYTKYSVSDMGAEAKAALDASQAQNVRSTRDSKIAETDWTQGKDIPDNISSKWAVYRQALRDVPAQSGFPWTVQWPTKPE